MERRLRQLRAAGRSGRSTSPRTPGETVEISIAYVSDWATQSLGVFVDDVTLPDGTTTSFETASAAGRSPARRAGSGRTRTTGCHGRGRLPRGRLRSRRRTRCCWASASRVSRRRRSATTSWAARWSTCSAEQASCRWDRPFRGGPRARPPYYTSAPALVWRSCGGPPCQSKQSTVASSRSSPAAGLDHGSRELLNRLAGVQPPAAVTARGRRRSRVALEHAVGQEHEAVAGLQRQLLHAVLAASAPRTAGRPAGRGSRPARRGCGSVADVRR